MEDDLSIPNLILSHRTQLSAGQDFELELLNVPDGTFDGLYSVEIELLDYKGEAIHKEKYAFDASRLEEHTVLLNSAKFASAGILHPRLTISYKGKASIINEGLPFTVARPLTTGEMNWYSTPIRNLLKPVKAEVAFGEAREEALPEIISLPVTASVEFADDLNTVEVVQDRLTLYAYDNNDEFLQKDGAYVTLIMGTGWLNHPAASYEYSRIIDIKNAPGAVYFRAPGLPHEPKYTWPGNPSVPMEAVHFPMKSPKARTYFWNGWTTLAIPKAIRPGLFTVSGQIPDRPFAEQEFQGMPLAFREYGGHIACVDSGTQISLDAAPARPPCPCRWTAKRGFRDGRLYRLPSMGPSSLGRSPAPARSGTANFLQGRPPLRETEIINVNNREHGVDSIAVAKEMLHDSLPLRPQYCREYPHHFRRAGVLRPCRPRRPRAHRLPGHDIPAWHRPPVDAAVHAP